MRRLNSTYDPALNLQPGLGALLPMTQLPGCMFPASQEWDDCVPQPQLYQWVGLVTWSGLEKQTHVMGKNVKTGWEHRKACGWETAEKEFKRQARNRESWFRVWEEDFFGSSCKTTIYRAADINLQGYKLTGLLGKERMLVQSMCFKGCKGGDNMNVCLQRDNMDATFVLIWLLHSKQR